jgi:hypothetical protein
LEANVDDDQLNAVIADLRGAIVDFDNCAADDCSDCAAQAVEARARESLFGDALSHYYATPPVATDEEENTDVPF